MTRFDVLSSFPGQCGPAQGLSGFRIVRMVRFLQTNLHVFLRRIFFDTLIAEPCSHMAWRKITEARPNMVIGSIDAVFRATTKGGQAEPDHPCD